MENGAKEVGSLTETQFTALETLELDDEFRPVAEEK